MTCALDNDMTAFYAVASNNQQAANPFAFSLPLINYNRGFNNVTQNIFTCPRKGIYWFFYTVVSIADNDNANISMIGLNFSVAPLPQIYRLHTNVFKGVDTSSGSVIRSVDQGQNLSIASKYLTHYVDSSTASAWGGFGLDNIMSIQVIYSLRQLFNVCIL